MMSKYDVGELITALNEAVNKLNNLRTKYDDLEKENARLRAALGLAIDAVEHWASYASPYFQEKNDLAGDLQQLRAALGEKE